MDLEPLWQILRKEKEMDIQIAIQEAGLDLYEGRMAVRDILYDFTIRWKKLARPALRAKKQEREIKELANSDLFKKIILLEKCENSEVTPEGLDLKLWWEKFRYCKTISMDNPLFDINNPIIPPLTYNSLLERRINGKFP